MECVSLEDLNNDDILEILTYHIYFIHALMKNQAGCTVHTCKYDEILPKVNGWINHKTK